MQRYMWCFFIFAILILACKTPQKTDEETVKAYYSFIPVPYQEKDGYYNETKKNYHSYLIGVENFDYQDTLFRRYLMIVIKGLIAESYNGKNIVEGYFKRIDRDFFYYSNDKGGGDRFPGSDALFVKGDVSRFEYNGKVIKLVLYLNNSDIYHDTILIPYKITSND